MANQIGKLCVCGRGLAEDPAEGHVSEVWCKACDREFEAYLAKQEAEFECGCAYAFMWQLPNE